MKSIIDSIKSDWWGKASVCLIPFFIACFITILAGDDSPYHQWLLGACLVLGIVGFAILSIWPDGQKRKDNVVRIRRE